MIRLNSELKRIHKFKSNLSLGSILFVQRFDDELQQIDLCSLELVPLNCLVVNDVIYSKVWRDLIFAYEIFFACPKHHSAYCKDNTDVMFNINTSFEFIEVLKGCIPMHTK